MNTRMLIAIVGLSASITTPAMAGSSPTYVEFSRAEQLFGGQDKNMPNPLSRTVLMQGKAAYGAPAVEVPSRGDSLKGGYDRNLPNKTFMPVMGADAMSAGVNNAGYDMITGPYN